MIGFGRVSETTGRDRSNVWRLVEIGGDWWWLLEGVGGVRTIVFDMCL